MNKKYKILATTMLALLMLAVVGCTKENDDVDPDFDNSQDIVRVTTFEPFQITMTSAACGGSVEADVEDSLFNARYGICWGKESKPTVNNDCHVFTTDFDERFELMLVDSLEPGNTYYVRAFVENDSTCYYGRQYRFTTLTEWGDGVPSTGYLNGKFSVSPMKKVRFSKGYLQYQASTDTWRFADKQYTIISDEENANASENYSGWIDGFGFGTSGWYGGKHNYLPYSRVNEYHEYGPRHYAMEGNYIYSDWGYYNAISNGGNQRGQWRLLTGDEWEYLKSERTTPSGIRYANALVDGVPGRIFLPDDWVSNESNALINPNTSNCHPEENTITLTQWTKYFEPRGAVFLAGTRMWLSDESVYFGYYRPGNPPIVSPFRYTPMQVRLVHTLN